jgi:hypothetical protein
MTASAAKSVFEINGGFARLATEYFHASSPAAGSNLTPAPAGIHDFSSTRFIKFSISFAMQHPSSRVRSPEF